MASHPQTRVELSREGPVATLRFAGPDGVNVLSSSTLGELGVLVQQVREMADVRFVVFTGSGRTFLAGADIREMSVFGEDRGEVFSKHGHHVFNGIEALPQVTFAAINGHALGGGCELALACDFRVMAATATIGQPESRLGLIPGWGGTQRLPRLVGLSAARRLLFSGAAIPAQQAREMGLVDEVVPTAEDLPLTLRRWFDELSAGSPAAVRRIKHALLFGDEITQFACCFSCSDAREGMAAFLEKRRPSWAPQRA